MRCVADGVRRGVFRFALAVARDRGWPWSFYRFRFVEETAPAWARRDRRLVPVRGITFELCRGLGYTIGALELGP